MVEQVMDFIEGYDKEIGEAIKAECGRQRRNLELIASENIVSEPVMAAMGTVLTNKIRGRIRGKTLLRRMRVCGRGGDHCH